MKNTDKNKRRVLADEFKQSARASKDPRETPKLVQVKYNLDGIVKNDEADGAEAERTRTYVISTGTVDRDDDTIDPNGWEIGDFIKGGSVLWAHDRGLPMIGRPLDTWVGDGALKSTVQFTSEDENPFGFMIWKLSKGGFAPAASVGFSPIQWRKSNDRGEYAIDYVRQTLNEWSIVPVASNTEALAEAKSKGIDLSPMGPWLEKALDDGSNLVISRDSLECMYKSVSAPVTSVVVNSDTGAAGVAAVANGAPDGSNPPSVDANAAKASDNQPSGAPAPSEGSGDTVAELTKKLDAANARIEAIERASADAADAARKQEAQAHAPASSDSSADDELELDLDLDDNDKSASDELDISVDDFKSGLRDALVDAVKASVDDNIRKRRGRLD